MECSRKPTSPSKTANAAQRVFGFLGFRVLFLRGCGFQVLGLRFWGLGFRMPGRQKSDRERGRGRGICTLFGKSSKITCRKNKHRTYKRNTDIHRRECTPLDAGAAIGMELPARSAVGIVATARHQFSSCNVPMSESSRSAFSQQAPAPQAERSRASSPRPYRHTPQS